MGFQGYMAPLTILARLLPLVASGDGKFAVKAEQGL
jgi:uncharacterized membrane protein YphA (DoxX/SURF4 family)